MVPQALDGVVETPGEQGPAARARFREGVLHGLLEQFHPDGRLAGTMIFAAGELDGPLIEYDKAGRVALRQEYRDGQLHGPSALFTDGVIAAEMTYRDGVLDGELRSRPARLVEQLLRHVSADRGVPCPSSASGRQIHVLAEAANGRYRHAARHARRSDRQNGAGTDAPRAGGRSPGARPEAAHRGEHADWSRHEGKP